MSARERERASCRNLDSAALVLGARNLEWAPATGAGASGSEQNFSVRREGQGAGEGVRIDCGVREAGGV